MIVFEVVRDRSDRIYRTSHNEYNTAIDINGSISCRPTLLRQFQITPSRCIRITAVGEGSVGVDVIRRRAAADDHPNPAGHRSLAVCQFCFQLISLDD